MSLAIFSTTIHWEDVEELLASRAERDTTWSLYSRLPNSLKQKVRDENVHHISKGLEYGMMHDWEVVLQAAVSDVNLFDAIIDVPVKGVTDSGIEIKGTVAEVDYEESQLFITPDDDQMDIYGFKFSQVIFLDDEDAVEQELILKFDEAWALYESNHSIVSMTTGITYHLSNEDREDEEDEDDVTSWFMPREIRGGWKVVVPIISKDKLIEFLMTADDHILSRFTGESVESLSQSESQGTLGVKLSAAFDQKSEDELRTFQKEWK
ncbi:hypothetical protein [Paenibacillus periandrae]|uniref:hypothetical protein n=1 Tax=Paenibacillus periandrae TaxID=1761741 RepID=UPI001F09DA38|nr:hypothetical protein [Paenibacillus periandrae]